MSLPTTTLPTPINGNLAFQSTEGSFYGKDCCFLLGSWGYLLAKAVALVKCKTCVPESRQECSEGTGKQDSQLNSHETLSLFPLQQVLWLRATLHTRELGSLG